MFSDENNVETRMGGLKSKSSAKPRRALGDISNNRGGDSVNVQLKPKFTIKQTPNKVAEVEEVDTCMRQAISSVPFDGDLDLSRLLKCTQNKSSSKTSLLRANPVFLSLPQQSDELFQSPMEEDFPGLGSGNHGDLAAPAFDDDFDF